MPADSPAESTATEPRAPPSEVRAALTPAERARLLDSLVPIPREALPPIGGAHIDAERIAESAIGGRLKRRGRSASIGRGSTVYDPAQPRFAPDFFVVLDVADGQRIRWAVDHEGKGLDSVLEIHFGGDRKKDLERNVERYARLGIPEDFAYDAGRQRIHGFRPNERSGTCLPIVLQAARWRAVHLGAELGPADGRLRFSVDGALRPISKENERDQTQALDAARTRQEEMVQTLEAAQARAAEDARRAEALAARVSALEAELARWERARGGPPDAPPAAHRT
jgi:Uma2 family endonuclease